MERQCYLGIESAGEGFSLSLSSEEKLLGEIYCHTPQRQLVHLFPALVSLLKESELAFSSLKGIGVATGPGGYTGLRLGIITAKTLAQVLKLPVVSLNSLDLLAHNFPLPLEGALLFPVIDARKKEVFWAKYRLKKGKILRVSDYRTTSAADLPAGLKKQKSTFYLLGSGVRAYFELFKAALGEKAVFLPPYFDLPRAFWLAVNAEREIKAGRGTAFHQLLAFYLRPPDAVCTPPPKLALKSRK